MHIPKSILAVAMTASLVLGQRPINESICDYYTTVLLKENNATNQMTLLTLVVNTAVIGNYTQPNVGIAVPGILAKGTYNGTAVNLLPYFDGTLLSSNRGGNSGVSVNFLDDGGAVPLMMNKPANGTTSAQYRLLTHLYEFFGLLLGCSDVGMPGFPAYDGITSMYKVHKFMKLSNEELGYFITQVGLAAASFGVATSDVAEVGMALSKLFGYKCEPPSMIIPNVTAELQSICTDDDCPLSPNATCAAYSTFPEPATKTTNSSINMTTSASSTSPTTVSNIGGIKAGQSMLFVGTVVLGAIGAISFPLI